MVETRKGQGEGSWQNVRSNAQRRVMRPGLRGHGDRHLAAATLIAVLVVALGIPTTATPAAPSTLPASAPPTAQTARATTSSDGNSAATPTVTTDLTPVTAVVASTPATTPTPMPSVATLVAQVEAAGIVPGPTWGWSMGDTAALCGITPAVGIATGCTSWSSGVERTVFAGSPSLELVAHEVANAETEQSAVPTLLNEVGTAAAGTSWSPTDAVASCLVVHFLGFQDDAAGSWQCPASLASSVSIHIHDTIASTQTTAICGTTSGTSSVLTFTASSGTLSVTSPSGGLTPQVASAGAPVTVTGIGTFTASVLGGTATLVGVCEG